MANCYACKAEIVFDNEHIGKNGKKIPLDPATHSPHDCPMREKPVPTTEFLNKEYGRDKDDHGSEEMQGFATTKDPNLQYTGPKLDYVDHTAKGQSKVKIFVSTISDNLEKAYDSFLLSNNGKIKVQGAQFSLADNGFAIALYYEEVTK